MFVILMFAVIIGAVFSFGAMVQAYAGDANTTSVSKSGAKGSTYSVQTKVAEKVIVQRGDTLWDIATEHVVMGGNVRSYVNQLLTINHLQSSQLHEGQVLLLP
ncbi:LysM peptidoglycan-binding domain-containing protein [Paenibacillus aestuarii]|uniref:LysM peptidoglycan-binding domain-containing protein n=1 Tax=Paenibacillus aestuarii TaxID=516965 RepID=A0ABW0K5C3_9BACL|nr:LysM peptidoglycan-binding domain-containing protein [Paenibacillus aestuarii]